MRTSVHKTISDVTDFKNRLLTWAQQHREISYLDSNNYNHKYSEYDCIVAVDAFTSLQTDFYNAFDELKQYQQTTKDWLFGYLSYDLKNDTEHLKSINYDGLEFPELYFFQPKKIFLLKADQLEIHYLYFCDDEIESDFEEILSIALPKSAENPHLKIKQRITREAYLGKVQKMREHILRGDIYEANFCMEFYAEDAEIVPSLIFQKLNSISEPPFASYFRNNSHYIMSASPERYLKKLGSKLISQPIKGTAKRSDDITEDKQISDELSASEKERSENIMIVDLVRNDLSKTAARGSVAVEDLCGAYAFRQVHHLISTVISELHPEHSAVDAIKSTFPMGSMTGAPKISAMNIIENLEETRRGVYSGSLGYFTPQGNFDFNVVIRSILYNSKQKYVSFSVGSAITAEAKPESEYDECILKAKAMFEVLQ